MNFCLWRIYLQIGLYSFNSNQEICRLQIKDCLKNKIGYI